MSKDPNTETAVKAEEQTGLTETELIGLVKGDIDLTSLPSDKQSQFHNDYIAGDKELPAEAEGTEVEQKEPETAPQPDLEDAPIEPVEKVEEKDFTDAELKKKYYDKSNKLNTVNQKFKSLQKKLESMEKTKPVQKVKVKDDDLYSEDTIKTILARQEALESNHTTYLNTEKQSLKAAMDEIEQQKQMLELEKFQLEPEATGLRTSKSFDDINNLYLDFQTKIGGAENRHRFLTDPEFRKQKEAEGFNFPIAENDFKKYSDIVAVHNFKVNRGYPDYSSAYHMWCKENGKQPDPVQKAANESSEATTKKIIENSQESTILSPTDGRGGSSGMTPEQAEAWITANPNPKTPEQIRILDDILKRYGGDDNPQG